MKRFPVLTAVLAVAGTCFCGCTLLRSPLQSSFHSALTLPDGHSFTCGQVMLHSNAPLDNRELLLGDLAACREHFGRKLDLPESDEKIHVYLFDDTRQYETFMRLRRPGFSQRRAGFIETENRMEVYAQLGEHIGTDLCHEIVHGYIHSVAPNTPLWLDEGLAEYFEVSRDAGGVNEKHLGFLCGKLRDGRWRPDLKRLERLRPGDEMTRADYAEAWAWVHYLLESANPAKRKLPGDYLRRLRRHGSVEPLSDVLGRLESRAEDELIMHIGRLSRAD